MVESRASTRGGCWWNIVVKVYRVIKSSPTSAKQTSNILIRCKHPKCHFDHHQKNNKLRKERIEMASAQREEIFIINNPKSNNFKDYIIITMKELPNEWTYLHIIIVLTSSATLGRLFIQCNWPRQHIQLFTLHRHPISNHPPLYIDISMPVNQSSAVNIRSLIRVSTKSKFNCTHCTIGCISIFYRRKGVKCQIKLTALAA